MLCEVRRSPPPLPQVLQLLPWLPLQPELSKVHPPTLVTASGKAVTEGDKAAAISRSDQHGVNHSETHPEECVVRFHPEKGHRTVKHPSEGWQRMRNRRFSWRLFEIPFQIAQQIAAMAATTALMGSLWGEYPPATQKAPKDSGCGAGAWLPPISCVIDGGTGGRGG